MCNKNNKLFELNQHETKIKYDMLQPSIRLTPSNLKRKCRKKVFRIVNHLKGCESSYHLRTILKIILHFKEFTKYELIKIHKDFLSFLKLNC